MTKVNIYLSDKQVVRLKKMAEDEGVSFAEILRRAITYYFKQLDREAGDD